MGEGPDGFDGFGIAFDIEDRLLELGAHGADGFCLPAWDSLMGKTTNLDFAMVAECAPDEFEENISAEIADWSREIPRRFWDPNRKLLLTIRRYQYWRDKRGMIPACLSKWLVLRYRFWSVITGADIPLNCTIGGGLLIPHPNGIVIHPEAKIGVNCLIFQQVTIGSRGQGVPVIEGHVDVGAGAKILGPVRIGAHARIGANSVVIADVPRGATVAGIPARTVDLSLEALRRR